MLVAKQDNDSISASLTKNLRLFSQSKAQSAVPLRFIACRFRISRRQKNPCPERARTLRVVPPCIVLSAKGETVQKSPRPHWDRGEIAVPPCIILRLSVTGTSASAYFVSTKKLTSDRFPTLHTGFHPTPALCRSRSVHVSFIACTHLNMGRVYRKPPALSIIFETIPSTSKKFWYSQVENFVKTKSFRPVKSETFSFLFSGKTKFFKFLPFARAPFPIV